MLMYDDHDGSKLIVDDRCYDLFREVRDEFSFASDKFGPFNSAHEGYAVLAEEVDELWDEVKAKQGSRNLANMRKEAVQVAAMAIRFVYDICDGGRVNV